MVVDINIDKILKLGITADVYILLYFIHKKNYTMANKYLAKNPVLTKDVLEDLINKRLIHNSNSPGTCNPDKIQVRETFVESVIKPTTFYDEFLEHFPVKVLRPDGVTDYLRSDLKRCKVIYNKIVKGDRETHNNILRYLDEEVKVRNATNQMKFMKRLPKWLASEEWETWRLKLEDSPTDNISLGYGQHLN
jgi:hypothetical protein